MEQYITLESVDKGFVNALLCSMQWRHLEQFEMLWKSMLTSLRAEDAFWDWARKKRLAITDDRYEAYAVEYDNLTQGLMWIETQRHHSWWASGQPLVYVEALASAPWNRRLLNPEPWLRGVGSAMLEFACQRSSDLGYQGRLGLHALPGSESFYESRNMLNLGYDADRDMIYFEYGTLDPHGVNNDV